MFKIFWATETFAQQVVLCMSMLRNILHLTASYGKGWIYNHLPGGRWKFMEEEGGGAPSLNPIKTGVAQTLKKLWSLKV